MKIRIENAYSDGHESTSVEDVPEYTGVVTEDDELLHDHLFPYTGDGHGIGRDLDSMTEITILDAVNPALVGRVLEFGG